MKRWKAGRKKKAKNVRREEECSEKRGEIRKKEEG